jgi:hypothetical protein
VAFFVGDGEGGGYRSVPVRHCEIPAVKGRSK